jgi:hypothetical protein
MLAYQIKHMLAQSYENTTIKPMQQESSLFSQDDSSCSHFLPHQCSKQKKPKKMKKKSEK